MDQLFNPKSVVVIGVSEDPQNLARNIVENLFKFQFHGEIFLIGRSEGILFGRGICTSLEDLREGIDVAVILTPAQTVPAILEACGKKKIRWAVIESGGFSEYSEEGAKLEKEALRIARKWGIRIAGPNGIGINNFENGFVVGFPPLSRKAIKKGKVSLLVQSGGVSLTYMNLLSSASVGISKVVSMGNKIDLDEIDYLKYLIQDPQTEIIGIYLESIARGRDLLEIARSTSKPIILHKANTGEASKEIAKLHTAALASDDKIVEMALKQADIVRARDFRSFINAVKVLSLPPMKGNDLVILSRSGGIAIVAADSAERYGFRLFPMKKSFQDRIHSYFRAKVIQPTNPLDLGDLFDFDLYTKILEQVLKIKAVDGIIFQHAAVGEEMQPSRKLIHAAKEFSHRYKKPVAFCYLTEEEESAYIKRAFDYPIFTEPEDALSALAISREHYYRKRKILKEKPPSYSGDRNRIKQLFKKARDGKRDPLLPEAFEILKAYGIPIADYQVVCRKEELEKVINRIKSPVALKVISPSISHKSDRGGVILNLDDLKKAEQAYNKIKQLARGSRYGVLMQKMISDGKEVILGAKRDPSFGPVILFGLGGIYVEVLKETSLRVAPINRLEAEEMISELKTATILKGVRGERPLDINALVESLLRLSQLMMDFPEIEGIDINPVKVLEKGAVAVDARIVLRNPQGT
ncbi:MAG TPA: acetate--CoA ligase family protein [Thermodesulfobacteriota bacterium]|nr:acetate--CoA ligase family protein [Thermodesulfobacteriota bacterium]